MRGNRVMSNINLRQHKAFNKNERVIMNDKLNKLKSEIALMMMMIMHTQPYVLLTH